MVPRLPMDGCIVLMLGAGEIGWVNASSCLHPCVLLEIFVVASFSGLFFYHERTYFVAGI